MVAAPGAPWACHWKKPSASVVPVPAEAAQVPPVSRQSKVHFSPTPTVVRLNRPPVPASGYSLATVIGSARAAASASASRTASWLHSPSPQDQPKASPAWPTGACSAA